MNLQFSSDYDALCSQPECRSFDLLMAQMNAVLRLQRPCMIISDNKDLEYSGRAL